MKLDTTFANEIKKYGNGDGSREHRFAVIEELKETAASLGNRYTFDGSLKKYGRVKVALCFAVTIMQNEYRYETPSIMWAKSVMDIWTNRSDGSISAATINIHPGILSELSRPMRVITSA